MPKTLISSESATHPIPEGYKEGKLMISELFIDTIQGEGRTIGFPCIFIRFTGCTLNCSWCDTTEVWRKGLYYTFEDLFTMLEISGTIGKLKTGQHLILTGGSPLKQQKSIVEFLMQFISKYGFKPFIEVENECVLMPSRHLISLVDQWNNSPKLANSNMKVKARMKPDIILATALLPNSWFKFVVYCQEDWNEILSDFVETGLVTMDQIILMPLGINQEELSKSREFVVNLCTENSVLFSDRLHITIWDKKTGV